MEQPAWLDAAWAELGVREKPGAAHEKRILQFAAEAGAVNVSSDEVPWCAAFAGAMLKRGGEISSRSLMARSYATWGRPSDERLGAVAVFERGRDASLGHVGFLAGSSAQHLYVLGGNQGNAVSVARFERDRLVALRWPSDAEPSASTDVFLTALAHVLDMEGGFTDDPHDPGGPTNRGITLDDFARWRGLTVNAVSRTAIVEDLRRIGRDEVQRFYRRRYWDIARCDALAGPIALFHFDAAVNHGIAGAARMIQQAAGVEVDGEIGPLTIAAITAGGVEKLLAAYADLRRQRYRRLPHFWRFGRGWLVRVDRTLAAARALLPNAPQPTGDQHMTNEQVLHTDGKWWLQSRTIWGALITAAATVIPALAPIAGIDLSGDIVRDLGEQTIGAVQAVVGLFGTLLTIYGRLTAKSSLGQRVVNVKV